MPTGDPQPGAGGAKGKVSDKDVPPWDENKAPPVTNSGPNADPPPRPDVRVTTGGGSTESDGDDGKIVVTPEALLAVKEAFDEYIDPLTKALAEVKKVQVRPGAFPAAAEVRTKIEGESGIAGAYATALTNLLEGIKDLSNGMTAIVERYQKAEKSAEVTSEDILKLMAEASGDFSGLTGSGAGGK